MIIPVHITIAKKYNQHHCEMDKKNGAYADIEYYSIIKRKESMSVYRLTMMVIC